MNKFKNYLWMAAGLMILVAVVSAFVPSSALAQIVKAALVKNVDERGRTPFSIDLHCENHSGNGCIAPAPSVPAGKRLVLEHITGYEQSRGPLNFVSISFGGHSLLFDGIVNRNDLFFYNYTFNASILAYVEAGQQVSLSVNTNTPDCNVSAYISGYLVDLTI